MSTKIEWINETWNPVTGCTPISPGCQHCYAQRMSKRLAGRFGYPQDDPFKVTLHPDRMMKPTHWLRPRMIFVCSMGDLFHDDVLTVQLDELFGIMLACAHFSNYGHTFQILTKRPKRMLEYLSGAPLDLIKRWAKAADGLVTMDNEDVYFSEVLEANCSHHWDENRIAIDNNGPWSALDNIWPLSNVWLGVTAENQEAANERIPLLLKCQAAVRFVSCEPLLERVSLRTLAGTGNGYYQVLKPIRNAGDSSRPALDWVIAGAETGPRKRPMDPIWPRSLRNDCQAAGVPFFFKKDSDGNRELDGKLWEEMP